MAVRVPQGEVNQMVALYESGLTIAEVAERVHWSPSCVYRNLRVRRVEIRKRGSQRGPRLDHRHVKLTVLMYRKGYSMVEIGEALGLATTTIHYRLHRAGEPIRSSRESLRLRWARTPRKAAA